MQDIDNLIHLYHVYLLKVCCLVKRLCLFMPLQHIPWCGPQAGSRNDEDATSKESKQMAFKMSGFSDQGKLYSVVMTNVLLTSRLDPTPTQEHSCHTERKDCPLSFGAGPSYKSANYVVTDIIWLRDIGKCLLPNRSFTISFLFIL